MSIPYTPGKEPHSEEGIFPHECVTPGCTRIVEFDDEPWCFTHSPDEGSSLRGYSARTAATEVAHRNVFDEEN